MLSEIGGWLDDWIETTQKIVSRTSSLMVQKSHSQPPGALHETLVNNVICTIFHWWSPEVFHQQYQQVQYIFINIIFQSSLAQCSFNDPAAWLLDYHYFFNISGSPSYHGFMPHHMHCFWNGDRTFGSRSEESQEATTTNMAVSTKPLPLNFNLLFL